MKTPEHRYCPRCLSPFRMAMRRCPRDGTTLEAKAIDPLIGMSLSGRYVIESAIGEGGIGRVYRAKHLRISRRYAVKVPFGELASDAVIRRRFANEAEAASRLDHPNLVSVVDVGESESGLLYLVMDLVIGPTLADIIDRGEVSVGRALNLIAQVADGLDHAHRRGLIHRDLKPDNIIVETGADGLERARIADFGIALLVDSAQRRLTADGMVIGTPEYMAPEQLTGAAIDARADLFALGLLTYELVTGARPFDGSSHEVAARNVTEELPPMASRARGRSIDPRIEALVRELCAKRPARRPANAGLVADRFRKLLGTGELGGASDTSHRRHSPHVSARGAAAGRDPATAVTVEATARVASTVVTAVVPPAVLPSAVRPPAALAAGSTTQRRLPAPVRPDGGGVIAGAPTVSQHEPALRPSAAVATQHVAQQARDVAPTVLVTRMLPRAHVRPATAWMIVGAAAFLAALLAIACCVLT